MSSSGFDDCHTSVHFIGPTGWLIRSKVCVQTSPEKLSQNKGEPKAAICLRATITFSNPDSLKTFPSQTPFPHYFTFSLFI